MDNDQAMLLKKPLGELIAEQLRQDIYNRKFEFGERLIEADLAERFDVSRSTIREALKILEQEELITSKARKGTFINEFTEKDLDELTEVRLMIETTAFVKAMNNLKNNHFQDLEAIINKMEKEAENDDWNQLFNLDMEFHQYVINQCGNSRMIKIYESIGVQIRVYLAHLDKYYTSPKSFYKEHRELLDVIKKKDKELIMNQISNHIDYVEEKLLRKKD